MNILKSKNSKHTAYLIINQNETNSSQKVQPGMHKIKKVITFYKNIFQILNQ
jgi:hypothetical protein